MIAIDFGQFASLSAVVGLGHLCRIGVHSRVNSAYPNCSSLSARLKQKLNCTLEEVLFTTETRMELGQGNEAQKPAAQASRNFRAQALIK